MEPKNTSPGIAKGLHHANKVRLYFFGTPRGEREGNPIQVDTRKAWAVLAYLARTGRQSRDKLSALLWPGYDQHHARAALRRTLSTLNKALDREWLDLEREQLRLQMDTDLWLDVEVFSSYLNECLTHGHTSTEVCQACIAPLAEAVVIYSDDFLAGFSLRDSPDFDDWQYFQAESLRRDLASALERLVYGYSIQRTFDHAITVARRWLALDRLHEPAHRALMQLYMWTGQRTAALHQYRECIQALEQELSVSPLEATTQLYQAIKENRPPAPPTQWQASNYTGSKGVIVTTSAAPLLAPSSPPSYPLVGRSAELAALTRAYNESRTSGHLVIIEGEAGIGKSRLAEEFVAARHKQGATIIAGRSYQGETALAYGPMATGLRTLLGQPDYLQRLKHLPPFALAEAARLLPELSTLQPGIPAPLPLDNSGTQGRFFEALKHVIQALCGNNPPGVLFLDDIHWADNASLDFLLYLIRRLQTIPLCFLFTWRSEIALSDTRLQLVLAEAQRLRNATILSLERLGQAPIRELIQSTTFEQSGLGERLYQETEGLPFFLVEYLAALANGVLTPESENWSLPGGARDLLRSRLIAVSETGAQLLATAAVIGRSFDFDTLRETSGRSEEEAVAALEELLALRLVREVHNAGAEQKLIYDFSHEKLRELVYEETSLARRRLLHRRIAEAFIGHARHKRDSRSLASQIAHHYHLAGNESSAADYFRAAGEYARQLYANAEALEHFQTALALEYPEPASLHESIGDLRTLLGAYSAALRSYEIAAALSKSDTLATIEYKIGTVYERQGNWKMAESHFEAALAGIDNAGPANIRSSIYADWSRTAYHQGELGRALDLAQQALDFAEAAQDTRALAKAHNILGILTTNQGHLDQATKHLEESLTLAEHLGDLGARVAALNNLALVCRASEASDRAIQLTEAALALCSAQGDRHREAALHNNLADLLHSRGQTEEAMSHLKQAVIINTEIDKEAGSLQPEIWKLTEW